MAAALLIATAALVLARSVNVALPAAFAMLWIGAAAIPWTTMETAMWLVSAAVWVLAVDRSLRNRRGRVWRYQVPITSRQDASEPTTTSGPAPSATHT